MSATSTDPLRSSAWGRICLFGEHQDYLRLPVIAAAVQLHITITGTPRRDDLLVLHLPDIGAEHVFPLRTTLPYAHMRDYLPAAINVLRRDGVHPAHGWECTVQGTIPINAGTSSSSALVVAWVKFLVQASGAERTPAEVAILANRAEVLEFGEPGGLMDHYLSALGGIQYLDFTTQPARIESLHAPLSGFILGDSQEPKATTGVLHAARQESEAALAWLQIQAPDLDFYSDPIDDFAETLAVMPAALARKLQANLVNRDLCQHAHALLRQGSVDPSVLGSMLSEHHRQLATGIGVSTPKLDRMVHAACDAGAFGGKLNGLSLIHI